jgi:hypothetical protein
MLLICGKYFRDAAATKTIPMPTNPDENDEFAMITTDNQSNKRG